MSEMMKSLFLQGAGPLTLVGFLVWCHAIYRIRPATRPEWQAWLWPVTLGLVGAVWAFTSTAVHFKVLSDETNLLSVANMLALFGKASNTEMWVYYYHSFHPLDFQTPTRPVLFPLLTALVHTMFGVSTKSPFIVNFVCLFSLLACFIKWAIDCLPKEICPKWLAFFACLMSPVLLINATSAGYDLSSMLFGFFSAWLLYRALSEYSDDVVHALFFSLYCFASVRYESIVALPLAALALKVKYPSRAMPWSTYATITFLLIPVFLQRVLTWGSFENPPDVPAFSLGHFADHFTPFVKSFFLDTRGPYPILLHWLGLVGVLVLVKNSLARVWPVLGYGAFLLFLLLAHHFGFAGHPTQARLFLPVSFGLVASGLWALGYFHKWLDSRALLGVFAVLVVHHQQYSLHDPLMTQLTMTREVRHMLDYFDKHTTKEDLFIYDRPGQITATGRSALSWQEFEANRESYMEATRRKLYQRIIAVDRPTFGAKEDPLTEKKFIFTPLVEYQLSPMDKLRVSVISVQ